MHVTLILRALTQPYVKMDDQFFLFEIVSQNIHDTQRKNILLSYDNATLRRTAALWY